MAGTKATRAARSSKDSFNGFWDISKAFWWFDSARDSFKSDVGKEIEKLVNGDGSRRSKIRISCVSLCNFLQGFVMAVGSAFSTGGRADVLFYP